MWRHIANAYALRPDELKTLEDICGLSDMIEALSAAWIEQGRPMTAKGSAGQLLTYPLVSEVRMHRLARNALWRQLKVPDQDQDTAPVYKAHKAAQSRWSAAHGPRSGPR